MKTNQVPLHDKVSEAYNRDGYWIEHGMFPGDECEGLKQEALRVLREKARPGRTVYVGVAAASPLYYQLASDPRIVSVLQKIMPDGTMFMSDKFVFKSGQQTFATPWHYDRAYWRNTRPKISVWIPLDDATAENGTLKVVRGSHRREWQHQRADEKQVDKEFANFISDSQWKPEDEVICELKRGGAIFFSDRTVHASCENKAGLDRYAIISTYHAPAEDEEFDKQFSARHVIVSKA
jgi:ectoine hydroxylase-related dioxygenase (phytanoyl-CoA dioxygenase family)